MKPTLLVTFLFLAFSILVQAPARADEEKVLHVYNWVEYIGETTLADFEKATGIKVTYDVYDSNDVLQGKLLAGNSGYDVVIPTNGYLARLIAAGVFHKLDHSKLPNMKNMDPELMEKVQRFDPGNQYGIPYLWGTTGIGVNEKLVKAALGDDAPVDSWDLVLDPKYASKLKDCGISFLDAYDEIFPAVLNYEGEDPTSQDVNLFKTKVEPVLEAVHPYIRYYNSSKYINDLANGDICAAVGWSGDVLQAAARAEEAHQPFKVSYSIPKEGTLIWIDMMAIPIDAPHPDNAHKFINFLMDPKVIAGVSNTVRYANGNKAADEFVDPDLLADKQVYPPADVRSKCYTLPPYPPKVDRQGLRMWTRIKTGR